MFTVIPKSCPHCTRSEQQQISRWEYLFIDVEGFLKEVYKERPGMQKKLVSRLNGRPVIASCGQYPQIAGLIRNILEEMREKQEFHKESIRGYLLALLVELARKSEEGEETLQPGGDEKRIAVVLDYIAEKFAEDIKVSDLAALCHVSETHFRRIFEKMNECVSGRVYEYDSHTACLYAFKGNQGERRDCPGEGGVFHSFHL